MAKRAVRPPVGVGWIVTWPLMLVFAALVFLSADEMQRSGGEAAPSATGPDWTARLPDRIAAVTAALQESSLRPPPPIEERKGSGTLRWTHRHYVLSLPAEERAKAEVALAALRDIDPGVTITSEGVPDGMEIQVGLDGLLTHTLRVRWQQVVTPRRVAFVVGPLGDDLRIAREFAGLDAPIAFGVQAFRPFSKEVAELARLFEREVLLHFSAGGDGVGGSLLQAAASKQELARDLAAALASVPHVIGVSAQWGPDSPEAAQRLDWLRVELERRPLFFVASARGASGGTAPGGGAGASVILIEAAGRPAALGPQLEALAAKAGAEGGAIGLGRPTAALLQALRAVLSDWRAAGIEVVPVSALAPATLSAR